MKLHYLKGTFEIFLKKFYSEAYRVLEALKIDDEIYDCIQQGHY